MSFLDFDFQDSVSRSRARGDKSSYFLKLGDFPFDSNAYLVMSVDTDSDHPLALNQDFLIKVTLLLKQPLDLTEFLGGPAIFVRLDDMRRTLLHCVIVSYEPSMSSVDHRTVDVFLASPLYLLKKKRTHRVFVDREVVDVAMSILEDSLGHLCSFDILAESGQAKAMLTQYNESDYEFILRILSNEGLFVFLDQQEECTQVLITDDLSRLPLDDVYPIQYFTNSGSNKDRSHASGFFKSSSLGFHSLSFKSYNSELGLNVTVDPWLVDEGKGVGNFEYFGLNYPSPESGEGFIRRQAKFYHMQSSILKVVTNCMSLCLGQTVDISGHSEHSGSYRIIKMAFHADQSSLANIGGESNKESICIIWVIPADMDYKPFYRAAPVTPLTLSAKISEEVDERGYYRVRYPFSSIGDDEITSSPAPLIQPFGGSGHGMHFPLAEGSEVLVAGLNGDLERPIILGAMFNEVSPDLVTSSNSRMNLIKTRAGNSIEMEDTPGQESIVVSSPEGKNYIHLDAKKDGNLIELESLEGDILLEAGRNIVVHTGASLFIDIGEDQDVEIQGDDRLLTGEGGIFVSSGGEIVLSSEGDFEVTSNSGDGLFYCDGDASMYAGAERFDEVEQGNYIVQVHDGDYSLMASGDIFLSSSGGDITISNGGAEIRMTSAGDLILDAVKIELEADDIDVLGEILSAN